jgi:hypothetical protein
MDLSRSFAGREERGTRPVDASRRLGGRERSAESSEGSSKRSERDSRRGESGSKSSMSSAKSPPDGRGTGERGSPASMRGASPPRSLKIDGPSRGADGERSSAPTFLRGGHALGPLRPGPVCAAAPPGHKCSGYASTEKPGEPGSWRNGSDFGAGFSRLFVSSVARAFMPGRGGRPHLTK